MNTKKPGKCLVCGNETTEEAHLFPRALMLDIRGTDTKLVEGNRLRDGYRFRQNGQWDSRILCRYHEEVSGSGDNYSIGLIRKLRDRHILRTDEAWLIENPHPEKLTQFAYSTIWKYAVATGHDHLRSRIGPYEAELKNIVFGNSSHSLTVIIARQRFVANNRRAERMALAPFATRLHDLNVWMFSISGVSFYVKTDKRPFPRQFARHFINGNESPVVAIPDTVDITKAPTFRPILTRMLTRKVK